MNGMSLRSCAPLSLITPRRLALLVLGLTITSGAQAQGTPPPVVPPADRVGPAADQADVVRKLRTMAAALATQDRFSGVVLLAQGGRPVLEQAYGDADRDARRRMTVGTIMNVSSVGKLFTQIAIGQLAAAGKLSPDSTIATYWPDYPDAAVARTVTVRHLLTHRSGINGDIFQDLGNMRRNRDYVPAATRGPVAFAPGARTEYSNAGYVILGEIIERVSGEVYHEYIQRHVFAPAGMTASAFPARDSLPARAAIGYTRGGEDRSGPLVRATPLQPVRGSAAGGAFSSAGDLLRFINARRQGTLGVPGRMLSDQSAGGSPGSNVVISEGLPAGYDLIVLANVDPPIAETMADSVERWLGGGRSGQGAPAVGPVGAQRIILRGSPDEMGGPQGPMLPSLPDTPRGRAAAAYFRAFSSGDSAQMRTVIETLVTKDARTTDERVRRYLEIFADMGPLAILGVREGPDGSFDVSVRSEKNGELTVGMAFAPDGSPKIAGVRFEMRR